MFGTRADLVVVLVYLVQLVAPLAALLSFRLARARSFRRHKRIQLTLLAVCAVAVLALETRIRVAGGSGALTRGSSFAGAWWFHGLLGVHIGGAVLTYLAWGWLAVASSRRFGETLPGPFASAHRTLGKAIFGGLCFTALSATGMFWVGFVA